MAVVAPMPRARVMIAVSAKPGAFRNWRSASRISASMRSSERRMGLRLRCRDTQSPRRRFRWLELQWSHHRAEIYAQTGTGALLGRQREPSMRKLKAEVAE